MPLDPDPNVANSKGEHRPRHSLHPGKGPSPRCELAAHHCHIRFSCRIIVAIALGTTLAACTQIRDSGELVRHYFGYVKVITPAVHAPEAAVRVLEVENYGVWVSVDRRPQNEDAAGYGAGFGFRRDRRELIPLDCRVVVRLFTQEQMDTFLKLLDEAVQSKEGICVIQDQSHGS